MNCSKFGIALSWDRVPGRRVDLDLQAIAFDVSGKLLDAVYYNNLKALGRGLTHSGDETTGERSGFDESIWVNFQHLPGNVPLIVFVVACHSGGHLCDARNGKFHLLEDSPSQETGQFQLEDSGEEVDLVGALLRVGGGWAFRLVDVPAQDGQHFIDILEPTIGSFVRQVIPGAPRRIKAAFAMEKGAVVDLPKSSALQSVVAGLGWDTTSGEVDLDVSAVMLDGACSAVQAVFFGNLTALGMQHSGDNLTGAGIGDDETITVELERVPAVVQQIFFLINIYSRARTFNQVANPYCRLVTMAGEEICNYKLREAGNQQGLVMARLFREPGGARWGFQAIGVPCRGQIWKDSMPSVVGHARKQPRDLQSKHGLPPALTAEFTSSGICGAGGCCVQ
uniref:TerD domain-containing protein n=1 Tax=Pyrodinium bahamense TaxID=73915 RepID=A0A7S0AXP3_9DINO